VVGLEEGGADAVEELDLSEGPGGWLYFVTPTAIRRIVAAAQ